MDEQFKLAHKVIDAAEWANEKVCVTLLRYNAEKPESSYAHIRIFAMKKEDQKLRQIVFKNYELEEFIYLLDGLISVFDKKTTNETKSNAFKK